MSTEPKLIGRQFYKRMAISRDCLMKTYIYTFDNGAITLYQLLLSKESELDGLKPIRKFKDVYIFEKLIGFRFSSLVGIVKSCHDIFEHHKLNIENFQ